MSHVPSHGHHPISAAERQLPPLPSSLNRQLGITLLRENTLGRSRFCHPGVRGAGGRMQHWDKGAAAGRCRSPAGGCDGLIALTPPSAPRFDHFSTKVASTPSLSRPCSSPSIRTWRNNSGWKSPSRLSPDPIRKGAVRISSLAYCPHVLSKPSDSASRWRFKVVPERALVNAAWSLLKQITSIPWKCQDALTGRTIPKNSAITLFLVKLKMYFQVTAPANVAVEDLVRSSQEHKRKPNESRG